MVTWSQRASANKPLSSGISPLLSYKINNEKYIYIVEQMFWFRHGAHVSNLCDLRLSIAKINVRICRQYSRIRWSAIHCDNSSAFKSHDVCVVVSTKKVLYRNFPRLVSLFLAMETNCSRSTAHFQAGPTTTTFYVKLHIA